jgi:hypothetical protein
MFTLRLHIILACLLTLTLFTVNAQVYPVKVKGKWGLITATGKQTAAAQYDAIPDIGPEHATIVMQGRYGLIEHTGEVLVKSEYAFVAEKEPGLVWINREGGEDNPGGKWGLINLHRNRRLEPTYDLIETFVGEWARVNVGGECDYDTCKGGLWGIIDKNAASVAQVEYTDICLKEAGEAFVKNDSGWGRLGSEGSLTIPTVYQSLARFRPDMIIAQRADTFGLLNDHNQVRIPFAYSGLKDAGFGYLAFQKGKKWGLMDTSGTKLTPAQFDEVIVREHGWVQVREDRKWGLVNVKGEKLFAPVLNQVGKPEPLMLPAMRDRRWGVIGTRGQIMIPFKFDEVVLLGDTLVRVRQGANYRWYTPAGQPVRKAYYDEIEPFIGDKVVTKFKHRGRWGILNSQGSLLAPPRFTDIRIIHSTAKMKNTKGEWEFVYFDELGNRSKVRRIVILKEEVDIESLIRPTRGEKGWYLASATNLWGLMKEGTSNVLIKPRYVTAMVVPETDLTVVQKAVMGRNKFGIVNHNKGEEVIEPMFDVIYAEDFLDNFLARGKINNTQGYALITRNGDLISHPNLTYIGEFAEGRARACIGGRLVWNDSISIDTLESRRTVDQATGESSFEYLHAVGGKWGFFDLEGNWAKEAEYEGALNFSDGACRVKMKGKWGMINENWEVIIPPRFDYIEFLPMPSGEKLLLTGMATPAYGFIDTLGELAIQPPILQGGRLLRRTRAHSAGRKMGLRGSFGQSHNSASVQERRRLQRRAGPHQGKAWLGLH